jgi:hypothetical protein
MSSAQLVSLFLTLRSGAFNPSLLSYHRLQIKQIALQEAVDVHITVFLPAQHHIHTGKQHQPAQARKADVWAVGAINNVLKLS